MWKKRMFTSWWTGCRKGERDWGFTFKVIPPVTYFL
jgi:hypothetical protein